MAITNAINALVQVLQTLPAPAIDSTHIGAIIPGKKKDLPALRVLPGKITQDHIGIGGVIGQRKTAPAVWEENRGLKVTGLLNIEVWAAKENDAARLASQVIDVLAQENLLLRQLGFHKIKLDEQFPSEALSLSGSGNPSAFKITLACSIYFEYIEQESIGPGGIIQTVDATFKEDFEEQIHIP